jgi:hypothetical protein
MKDTTPRETANVSGTEYCCTSRDISSGARPAQKLEVGTVRLFYEVRLI